MRLLKLLFAGAIVGVIVAAFRDFEADAWLSPADGSLIGSDDDEVDDTEPVLGYDGMDVDTLLDWIGDAQPDSMTLREMYDYERAHRARRAVLDALADRLG